MIPEKLARHMPLVDLWLFPNFSISELSPSSLQIKGCKRTRERRIGQNPYRRRCASCQSKVQIDSSTLFAHCRPRTTPSRQPGDGRDRREQCNGRKHELPEEIAIADQNPHARAGDRRDRKAGEHPYRRRDHVDEDGDGGRRPGIGIDADPSVWPC
jgi:hypothetical protein